MEYRGNPSLPKEIKDRILTTFQQTLQSAREGNYQEAMLGCDFILRLDPDFKPAQQLTERLRQVAGDDLTSMEPEVPPSPAAPAAAPPSADLGPKMQTLFEQRQLKPLMELAQQHRDAVVGNPELRAMVEEAQGLLEAEPVIRNLVQSGRQMLENGQIDAVDALLEKGRELDPNHPDLADLEALRQAMPAPQEESAGVDTGPIDLGPLEDDPLGSLEDSLGDDPFSLDDLPAEPEPSLELSGDPFSLGLEDEAPAPPEAASAGEATRPGLEAADPFSGFGDDDPFSLGSEEDAAPSLAQDMLDDPFSAEPESEDEGSTGGGGFDPGGSAGGEDSDSRIDELLNEGQTLFDQGDYQGSIDAWSRIFLIDIDHREATRRIEKARSLKAEHERQVEEIFHEGLESLKTDRLDEAKDAFRQVLELQPGYAAAQEYLQQLEAGEVPELTGISMATGPSSDTSTVPTPEEISGTAKIEGDSPEELKEEILVPPDPDMLPGGTSMRDWGAGDQPPAKESPQARRKFVMIGSGVLLLVLLLAAYAWLNRDRWFPNSEPPPAQPLQMPKNPLEEARRLHGEGKVDQALRQLKLLPQDSPYHEEAKALIAQWEGVAQTGPTLTPEVQAQRDQLLAESVQFFNAGEMLRAQEVLVAAGELAPLEAEATERMAAVQERLAPLQSEIAMVREGEWETALKSLWRLQVQEPGNRDVVRLLTDSYYNLGIQDLQRGNVAQAESRFAEVLQLDPDDVEAQRHYRFAQAYSQRETDLLFRTYVKYLPYR